MIDREFDDFETQEQCEEHFEPDDSMDGDFDSAMASAGLGTDEDYEHYSIDDTPLGEQYGGE